MVPFTRARQRRGRRTCREKQGKGGGGGRERGEVRNRMEGRGEGDNQNTTRPSRASYLLSTLSRPNPNRSPSFLFPLSLPPSSLSQSSIHGRIRNPLLYQLSHPSLPLSSSFHPLLIRIPPVPTLFFYGPILLSDPPLAVLQHFSTSSFWAAPQLSRNSTPDPVILIWTLIPP
ncbi:hypothetical protein BDQ12DRAFT_526973 [Crucibulum laeve]|uniref:Uncharacterized protein n=1 Tax=Crucibulum laeve TaxID=68775 RepID=A0A5C3LHK0_9AGAR|nr:hypothetical protein BDQ12DRAFT_526973 [Crucibulum laeve]